LKILKSVLFIIFLSFNNSLYCQSLELIDNSYNDSFYNNDSIYWISSENGWNKYNGEYFQHYKTSTNNSGLEGQWIQSNLYKDEIGNLWSSTYEYLNFYDSKHDEFKSIQPQYKGDTLNEDLRVICVDDKSLIIRGKDNLFSFDTRSFETEALLENEKTNLVVHHVMNSKDSLTILASSWTVDQKLEFWTRFRNEWEKRIFDFESCQNNLNEIQISDIQSFENEIWLITNIGIFQFDENNPCSSTRYLFNDSDILYTKCILFEEHLLITTDLNGLLIFSLRAKKFLRNIDMDSKPITLKGNSPIEIFKGKDDIILSFRDNGIQLIEKSLLRSNFIFPKSFMELQNPVNLNSYDEILTLCSDANLLVHNIQQGKLQELKTIRSNTPILDVKSSENGCFYITDHGLFKYDYRDNQLSKHVINQSLKFNRLVQSDSEIHVVASNDVYLIENKMLQRKFFAGLENQVIQYGEYGTDKYFLTKPTTLFLFDKGVKTEINTESYIYDLQLSIDKKELILALAEGLAYVNLNDKKVKELPFKLSVLEEIIAFFNQGYILNTKGGLYFLSLDYNSLKRITKEEVECMTLFQNLLIYISDSGIHTLNKKEVTQDLQDSIFIRSSTIPYELKEDVFKFEYKYDDSPLGVDITSCQIKNNEIGIYTYQIIGIDSIPQELSYREDLKLPVLPQGNYVVDIQGYKWDTTPANSIQLNLKIKGPFWNQWWFHLAWLSFVSFLIWLYFAKRTKRLIREFEIAEEIRQLEKSALQAQMNPHFIFNCLNSIQSFIMDNDKENAMDYLGRFAQLIRSNLNASIEDKITLFEEISILENYLNLEQLRLDNRFQFKIHHTADIDIADIQIPPMLIQPFVENAVIHGMKNVKENGLIEVYFELQGSDLKVTIKDNGILGESKIATPSGHKSVGVKITKKRLAHINQTPQEQVNVRRTTTEEGTKVLVTVAL